MKTIVKRAVEFKNSMVDADVLHLMSQVARDADLEGVSLSDDNYGILVQLRKSNKNIMMVVSVVNVNQD